MGLACRIVRAATIDDGRVTVREHPDPEPAKGELLVRVRSAGINAADLMQVAGFYPAPPGDPPDIPGMELAGEVQAVGPGVLRYAVGDFVMAVVGGGAQAELALVHERVAVPVPSSLGLLLAGGFPEAFTTAHDALFTQCGLQMGERLLVHAAAGGVGTAAVQLGAVAGAHVTATVRNPALRDAVASLGAHEVIAPEDAARHGPFDVVLELIGASNIPTDLDTIAVGGRIAVIGVGGGAVAEVNLLVLMQRRARIVGSTLRARPLELKADAARRIEASVLPLVAAGRLTVPLAASFPLDDVAAAYERFAAGGKLGKLVVLP
jgi:NADPH:quinone reductase-like Zn-dependent oxidoreductase